VKPKCLKIALISTLINTGCGLSVVSLWTGLSVSQTSEAIWLYTLRYHSIGLVDFSGCLHAVFTQTVCASFVASLQKCNNLRDHGHPYKLPDLRPPNSPELNPIDYKICVIISNESRVQKCRTWRIWCSVWLMRAWAGVEDGIIQNVIDRRRRRLTCIQPQKDIMNIHCDKN